MSCCPESSCQWVGRRRARCGARPRAGPRAPRAGLLGPQAVAPAAGSSAVVYFHKEHETRIQASPPHAPQSRVSELVTGCRPHVDARHRLREAMSPEPMASDRRGGGLTSHRWTRFKFGSLLLGLGRCHVLGPASSLVTGLCPSHLWGPSDALGGRKDRGARAGQTQQFSPVSRPGRGRGRSAGAVGGPPAGVARRIQRWEGLGPRAGARDEESRPRSACRNGIRVRAPVPPRSFPESPLSLRGQERPPCARATSHLVTALRWGHISSCHFFKSKARP